MIKKLILTISFVAFITSVTGGVASAEEKKKCFAWKVSEKSIKECFRGVIGGEAEKLERKKPKSEKALAKQKAKDEEKAAKRKAKEEREARVAA